MIETNSENKHFLPEHLLPWMMVIVVVSFLLFSGALLGMAIMMNTGNTELKLTRAEMAGVKDELATAKAELRETKALLMDTNNKLLFYLEHEFNRYKTKVNGSR